MDENLWILERERQRASRGLLLVPSEVGVRPRHEVRMNSFRLHVISSTGSQTLHFYWLLPSATAEYALPSLQPSPDAPTRRPPSIDPPPAPRPCASSVPLAVTPFPLQL